MNIVWGLVVVALSVLGWGGQIMSWLVPTTAARYGLVEAEDDVEAVYWADIRGEAACDALTLWVMVVAGVLLIVDSSAWPYFGLVGGGMYLYFAVRGIMTRQEMQRRRFRIGAPRSVQVGYAFLAVWGALAAITIVAGTISLA